MIVVDASALLEVLCQTAKASGITRRLSAESSRHAPHLIDIEIASGIRRLLLSKSIAQDRARQAWDDLAGFPLMRHAHLPLLNRIWELKNNFSSYDASYIALAEILNTQLITCDTKLQAAGSFVEIF